MWLNHLSASAFPSHISSPSPYDHQSETSSYSESQSSRMTILVERVVALLNRMVQADALTLTNRLKRQHLKGADVAHLSRSTINNISSEAAGLRTHFRALLEDEKVVTMCTRKDLRGLLKLFRDLFSEMGRMQITLNDIILDPSIAEKVSDMALHPTKVDPETKGQSERDVTNSSPAGRWMGPISKLFGAPQGEGSSINRGSSPLLRSGSRGRGTSRPPPRVIPKLGPALSASTTTVKVEFSGMGVGRSVTSTHSAHPSTSTLTGEDNVQRPSLSQNQSANVMGIFAGAPRSTTPDPWVVIPKGPRRSPSTMLHSELGNSATLRRSYANRFSRHVDAVIDSPSHGDEEPDYLGPLLQRTLRRRGLSDSSIHSTFMSHTDEPRTPIDRSMTTGISSRDILPDRSSVLQALSRTVQSFRLAGSVHGSGSDLGTSPPVTSSVPSSTSPRFDTHTEDQPRTSSPAPIISSVLPNLASWAASSGSALDSLTGEESWYVGSARDEPSRYRPRGSDGRQHF